MDSVILAKLQAFSARRRRLIVWRGVLAAVATLLGAMLTVALLDRFLIMPDALRWSLSGLGYVAVLWAEWRACWRLLLHAPGPHRLARLLEQTAPHLREDLLSAVELGEGDARFDSPVFRELLQASVAKRVAGLETQSLLPFFLLRRTLAVLAVVCAVLVGTIFLTDLPLGPMLVRALLPMANLDRISSVKVEILEPHPAEMPVPQGDSVPMAIRVSGGRVEKAYLETFTRSGGRNVIPMSAAGADRFGAALQVAREDVEYRVRAGDAITRKYRLHAAARPHVARFHKRFLFPAYAQLPPREVVEESGDLAGLEGTEVEMSIEAEPAVRSAELRIETSQATTALPLTKTAAGTWTGKVKLDASGLYRVRLVAAETGFENKFSPEYELRAQPDLIPSVTLKQPQADLIVSTRQTVEIAGEAADDLAVAAVEQVFKVNQQPWRAVRLPISPGRKVAVSTLWDLATEKLRAGDQITLKLAAVDQKGGRGESRPLQITLVEAGFDSRREETLAELARLHGQLAALRKAAEAQEKLADEVRMQTEKATAAAPPPAAAWQAYDVGAAALTAALAGARSELAQTLPRLEAGGETGTLVLLGRQLTRLEANALGQRALERSGAEADTLSLRQELARNLLEQARKFTERARRGEEVGRALLGAMQAGQICENLQAIWYEERLLSGPAVRLTEADAEGWARLGQRYAVIFAESQQVEQALREAAPRMAGDGQRRARQAGQQLEEQRSDLAKAFKTRASGRETSRLVANYAVAVSNGVTAMMQAARESADVAVSKYHELRQETQPAWSEFARVRKEALEILGQSKWPSAVRSLALDARWEQRLLQWKAHGDWEELRPDADNAFVQQLRTLALALPSWRERILSDTKSPAAEAGDASWKTLARAFQVLETVHDLSEVAGGLDALAAGERWQHGSLRARTSAPAAWFWLKKRLTSAPEEIGKIETASPLEKAAREQAQQMIWRIFQNGPGNPLDAEMSQRFEKERRPVAQTAAALETAARVRAAMELLQALRVQAEEALAQAAPTLSQRLAELAREAAEQKQRTDEQIRVEPDSAEGAREEARISLARQEKLNDAVEAVRDALRSEAQRQDLMQKEGRERARDADDAAAMLREPPPAAAQALAEAVGSQAPAERKEALENAASEQGKLAAALEKLAEHYDAMAKGTLEETRLALREAEKTLGIKPELDQQYAHAEELARAAESQPEEMLKKLEQALPNNPQMRQELSAVARETLQGAADKLGQAAAQEEKVALKVAQLASAEAAAAKAQAEAQAKAQAGAEKSDTASAPPSATPTPAPGAEPSAAEKMADGQAKPPGATPPPALTEGAQQQGQIAQKTKEAGEEVERAGRHEDRLNQPAGAQLGELGRQMRETAAQPVPKAGEALRDAPAATAAQPAVAQANERLKGDLGQLKQAMGAPAPPAGTPPTGSSPTSSPSTSPAAAPASGEPPPQGPGDPASKFGAEPAPPPGAFAQPGSPGSPGAQTAGNSAAPPAPRPPSPMANMPVPPPASPDGSPAPEAAPLLPPPGSAATPQQQVWMARALDALDAALHSSSTPGPAPEGDSGKSAGQPQGQSPSQAMAEAQQAMAQAAQAAAAAMRAGRSPTQGGSPPAGLAREGSQAPVSTSGMRSDGQGKAYGAMPSAPLAAQGDWGRLPKKVSEQLNQGQREGVAPEYRNQVETYYRVIAERAKKP